jgi:hypothetical protein
MNETPRTFLQALLYETDGDLNLTWLFVLIMGLVGSCGFVWSVIVAPLLGITVNTLVQIASWSFLAGAFASVLIAAIPLAKAKVLARATLPGELAKSVASVANNVETSTDIQELSQNGKLQPETSNNQSDI